MYAPCMRRQQSPPPTLERVGCFDGELFLPVKVYLYDACGSIKGVLSSPESPSSVSSFVLTVAVKSALVGEYTIRFHRSDIVLIAFQ